MLRAVKDAFIRLIRTMPNVNPEPQWISVSERLPKLGARVLISDGEDVEVAQLGKRYRDGYVWGFETCWNDLEDWPYWMPWPEPFKEGEPE